MVATTCPREPDGRTSKIARKMCLRGSTRFMTVAECIKFMVGARDGPAILTDFSIGMEKIDCRELIEIQKIGMVGCS